MEEKILKARVVNKHELEKYWNESSYIPRVGETVYYDPEINSKGEPDATKCPTEYRTKPEIRTRIKNGDGVHCVKDLPFGSDSILTGGDGEGSIIQIDNKAYGERSIALGNDSVALSKNSVTSGENTIAGAKGININPGVTIQKNTSITELSLESIYGLETTDILTIIDSYGYWYINYAKILKIDETTSTIKICPLDGRAEFKDTDFRMNVDNDRTLKYVIPTKSMTNKTQITEAYGGESAGRIYLYNSSLDDTWSDRDIIVEVLDKYYYTRAENLVRNDTGGWRGLYIPNTNIDISEPTNIWIYKASYDPEKLLLGSVEFGEGACSRGKNSTSLGNYTATIGDETEAAGYLAFAGGRMAKANGNGAFSFGYGTYAQGNYSNATGVNTKATIQAATSMGTNTVAEGQSSLATGEKTQASGKNSVSMGLGTKATKNQSVSLGNYTKAEGENSVSLGIQTISSGNNSIAAGCQTRAKQNNQVVLGEWNEDNANAYVIVGNGAGKRSNAFEVLKDGSFTYLYKGNKRNIIDTEKDIENLNENRDALNNVVFSIEPWTTSKTLSNLPDFVGMARIDKTKTTGVDKLILQSANLLDVLNLKEVTSSYKETGNIITNAVTSAGITFSVQNDGGIEISGSWDGGNWPQFKFLPNFDFVAGRTYIFNTYHKEIQFRITYTQGGVQYSEANPTITWTKDTKIDRFMIQAAKRKYNPTKIYPVIAYNITEDIIKDTQVPFKKQVLSVNESTYFTLGSFDTVEIIKLENYTGATSLVFELLHSENVGNNAKVLNGANNNKANYSRSTAAGCQTATSRSNQFVVGQYNADDADALFIVGNGDATTQKNALTVNKDGSITLGKTTLTEGQLIKILNFIQTNS